jgi:MFS family permease
MPAEPPARPARVLNANFLKIFVINVLGQYAVYSMNTLTGPFAHFLGATPTGVGIVSGLFALTAMAFKLVSAPTIDAFRRKPVLLFALGVVLVACACYTASHSISGLVVSRLLTGVALAFLPTVCYVIASDTLPPDQLGKGMGYFAIGTVVTQALAPAIGLHFVATLGYNATFGMVTALIAATVAFTAFTRFQTVTAARPFSVRPDSIFAVTVLAPTFLLLVEAMVWSQVNAFLVLFGETRGIPAEQVGLFFTVLAAVLVFSRPFIGHLADRHGASKILLASMALLAASFLIISWSHSLLLFLVSAVVTAFGYAGCQPTLMAVCFRLVPAERRGAASCTAYMGQDLGNLIGGVLGGSLVQYFGYASMWRLMVVPLAAAAVVAIALRSRLDAQGILPGRATATATASPSIHSSERSHVHNQ